MKCMRLIYEPLNNYLPLYNYIVLTDVPTDAPTEAPSDGKKVFTFI